MKPERVAILGAATPIYELFCPNFTGMQIALMNMGIEHRLFDIRPTVDRLNVQELVDFDPDLIVYGLIDMVKVRRLRLTIRRKLPEARIVMWYGDLRNAETGQIRADMSEIDMMFVSNNAQLDFYEAIWNVPECHFLPLGSRVNDPQFVERFNFDTVFIGGLITGKGFLERRNVMQQLKSDKIIKHIDGPAWNPKLRAKIMKEMPSIYRSSKICLDWSHFTDIDGYTSNRFWIITASGGFAMTKRWPGCEEWYPEGTRVYFDTVEEFLEKREYFLNLDNWAEREKIRLAGHVHAQLHTYEDRFERMFAKLYLS